jgi:sigma-54 specific flagellar transcriptional regulator A
MRAVFGESPSMLHMRHLLAASARSDASVLVQGETGVGKEVACRELHAMSARAQKPFVALNCAAIPGQLLESELFGYRRGAYTGATNDRKGRLELAHEGTLLLDEIGDMPLDLQAKLLRFLEDRIVEPLGGQGEGMRVDVRVIAATHKDLPTLIAAGNFREDLYYRLNVIPLLIPPLRERPDELPQLCRHFAKLHAANQPSISFSEASLAIFQRYEWPGNVRELSNLVMRFSVLYPGSEVELFRLPPTLLPASLLAALRNHGEEHGIDYEPTPVASFPVSKEECLLDFFHDDDPIDGDESNTAIPAMQVIEQTIAKLQANAILPPDGLAAKEILERVEIGLLEAAMRQADRNSAAARLLRMERTTFIQKLLRYGLSNPRKGS